MQYTYSFKKFTLTVAIPIITFWTLLFLAGYPIPSIDDLFFTGAAINYQLPKNCIDWNFMMPAPASGPSSKKDIPPNVTGIVSRFLVGNFFTDMQVDYPRVEFLGRKFKSLPKKPFELIVIP